MEYARTTGKLTGVCKEFVPSCHVNFILALALKASSSLLLSPFFYSHFYSSSPFLFSKLIAAFMLPSREALCLGERVITYLPRCADFNSEVRKISAQVIIGGLSFLLFVYYYSHRFDATMKILFLPLLSVRRALYLFIYVLFYRFWINSLASLLHCQGQQLLNLVKI